MINKNKVLFIYSAQPWYTRIEYLTDYLSKKYFLDIVNSNKKKYPSRLIEVLFKFLFLKNKKNYQFVFIGFLAQALIPFIRIFYKEKIVGDFFISLYDTICHDRKIVCGKSWLGKLIFNFEKWTIKKVDVAITDTIGDKNYFVNLYGIKEERIKVIYVLANSKLFFPRPERQEKNEKFRVFFYGSVRPLQGIEIILKTAKRLEGHEDISFVMVGPIKRNFGRLIDELGFSNVKFIDWVDYEKLPDVIAESDVCLGGHFSDLDKARRVIAGKTFQFAAMKKPVIIGDNPANQEIFKNEHDCLMVKMNDEQALSEAIIKLKNDQALRNKIAKNAYTTVSKVNRNIVL